MESGIQRTESARLVLPSRVEEAGKIRKLVSSLSRLDGFSDEDVSCIEVAVGEGVANAVRHGSPHGERDVIEVSYARIGRHCIEITITDHGTGFDLELWLQQVKPLSLSDGERGLLLISALMDEVSYTRSERGGELAIRKYHHDLAADEDAGSDRGSVTLRTRRGRQRDPGSEAARDSRSDQAVSGTRSQPQLNGA